MRYKKIPPKPEPKFRKYPIAFCQWCFTELERKVLSRILIAPVIKDISAALDLSEKTIKFYRSGLLRKFGVDNTQELLALLLRLNLQTVIHGINSDHRKSRDRRYAIRSRSARAEYHKDRQHRYYVANREKILEKTRKWRERNPEGYREQLRRYYKRHRQEIIARAAIRKRKKRKQ